jgi:tRNA nucleotidyltransferase (CCA-adding enzyme)
VRPASIEEDLLRRDFTAHALAHPLGTSDPVIRGPEGAVNDLDARTLRVMHPGSFRDDPTRLLRLVRYGARLDFEPDTRTDALARDAIAAGALRTVSAARIGGELRLLVAEATALAALTRVHAMELDRALHPSFDPRLDLAERALAQGTDARRDLLTLAACCTRFARDPLAAWLDGLEFHAAERGAVVAAGLDAETLAERLDHAHKTSELRHLLLGHPAEEIAMAAALGAAAPVQRWHREVRDARLEITGEDLLAAGVPEGPAVGRGLDAAWAARLDDGATDRETQLAAALQAARAQ